MEIRLAVSEYVTLGNALFNRLRSNEADMLTSADLHMLRVQLYILDTEAKSLERKKSQSNAPDTPAA
jgi:hypothetical protein